jgi:chemotaxis protein methyltransferase CheR
MMEITNQQFDKIRNLILENLGIHMNQSKIAMLQAKLDKLFRQNKVDSFDEYYRLLTENANNTDTAVWREFVDEVTVHQSSFFRENSHFEYIRGQMRTILETNKRIVKNQEIRVWSMACSTGEEPYTICMVLREWLPPEIAIRVLGTDISSRTLALAQNGIYQPSIKKEMDPYYITTYFDWTGEVYRVKPSIKEQVTFRLFNLIDPFPFRDTFDLVFCRNVIIYLANSVQERLIQKTYEVMAPGGILFLGHSESLLNKHNGFKYLQPTIYQKTK